MPERLIAGLATRLSIHRARTRWRRPPGHRYASQRRSRSAASHHVVFRCSATQRQGLQPCCDGLLCGGAQRPREQLNREHFYYIYVHAAAAAAAIAAAAAMHRAGRCAMHWMIQVAAYPGLISRCCRLTSATSKRRRSATPITMLVRSSPTRQLHDEGLRQSERGSPHIQPRVWPDCAAAGC